MIHFSWFIRFLCFAGFLLIPGIWAREDKSPRFNDELESTPEDYRKASFQILHELEPLVRKTNDKLREVIFYLEISNKNTEIAIKDIKEQFLASCRKVFAEHGIKAEKEYLYAAWYTVLQAPPSTIEQEEIQTSEIHLDNYKQITIILLINEKYINKMPTLFALLKETLLSYNQASSTLNALEILKNKQEHNTNILTCSKE